jgi:hypothetical protein
MFLLPRTTQLQDVPHIFTDNDDTMRNIARLDVDSALNPLALARLLPKVISILAASSPNEHLHATNKKKAVSS